MLWNVEKQEILKNLTDIEKNNVFMYSLKMKSLIQSMSKNKLSFDSIDIYGVSLPFQPVIKEEDYIQGIYRLSYEDKKLGIISISGQCLSRSNSLEICVRQIINNISPETLIVHLYEYFDCKNDSQYKFCISESREFPLVGYVKGKVMPEFDFEYDSKAYVRF